VVWVLYEVAYSREKLSEYNKRNTCLRNVSKIINNRNEALIMWQCVNVSNSTIASIISRGPGRGVIEIILL